jgi:hypothetical protein
MVRVFVTYRLRSDVTLADYMTWSRDIDQRTTPAQPGIRNFEVHAIEGSEGGEPWCEIIESIDVDSFEAFQQAVAGDGMKFIRESFPQYADESTVRTVYGSRVSYAFPDGPPAPVGQ